jgi:HK97 family phage major capsid protein
MNPADVSEFSTENWNEPATAGTLDPAREDEADNVPHLTDTKRSVIIKQEAVGGYLLQSNEAQKFSDINYMNSVPALVSNLINDKLTDKIINGNDKAYKGIMTNTIGADHTFVSATNDVPDLYNALLSAALQLKQYKANKPFCLVNPLFVAQLLGNTGTSNDLDSVKQMVLNGMILDVPLVIDNRYPYSTATGTNEVARFVQGFDCKLVMGQDLVVQANDNYAPDKLGSFIKIYCYAGYSNIIGGENMYSVKATIA